LQTFSIKIEGYWRDSRKRGVPFYSGIFFVYECRHNEAPDTVTLLLIIYIGEADNINDRIANHPRYQEWKSFLREGNELCFSAAPVPVAHRTQIKAAFIHQCQPIANKDYKDAFRFEDTTIQSVGKTHLLKSNFVVSHKE
jgi:hypothetical protein